VANVLVTVMPAAEVVASHDDPWHVQRSNLVKKADDLIDAVRRAVNSAHRGCSGRTAD
jgi:hypothetical protein